MKTLPIRRLYVSITLSVVVSSGISYAVCVASHNDVAMIVALVATLAATLFPIIRWWLSAARAAGVPKTAVTPSGLLTAATALSAIVVSLPLEVAALKASHTFVAEALVALAGSAVVAAVTAKTIAALPAQSASSSGLLRFSAIAAAVCTIVFAANLALAIRSRPPYAFGQVYHDYLIAGFFLLVPMNAFNAYRYWRRSKAGGSSSALPTLTS